MLRVIAVIILAALLLIGTTGCNNEATSPLSSSDALSKALENMDEQTCMGDPRGPLGHIAVALDLTDEQKEQIKALLEKSKPFKEDRGSFKDLSPEERKTKHQERHGAVLAEIMAILTPEQKALAEDIKAKIEAGECPEILIDKRIEKLDALVNLTEDQEAQLKAVMLEKCKERMEKRGECKGNIPHPHRGHPLQRGIGRGKGGMMHGKHPGEGKMKGLLDSILTADQKEILEQHHTACRELCREKMQKKRKEMPGKHMEKRLDKLTEELELTVEQREQIKAIMEAAHNGEKPDCDTPEACRELHQVKIQETHDKIMEILTKEQQEKFKEMIEKMKARGRKGRKGCHGSR